MKHRSSSRLKVAIVTGTRAEFGLLRPVMNAVAAHPRLKLLVLASGSHLLPPSHTIREIEAEFDIVATIPMQMASSASRSSDAIALGRGVSGFARAFLDLKPDWVVVLGDRIEAFAAGAAAAIAGIALCHIHGGDRAEGIADESMRHALSKLAHLHCAASRLSAKRLIGMGEQPSRVHVTGSPALDSLDRVKPLSRAQLADLFDPGALLLMHPAGLDSKLEAKWASAAADLAIKAAQHKPVLWLEPNHDPGRDVIIRTLRSRPWPHGVHVVSHLPRSVFVGLLKTLALQGAPLIGNSSAGLIEASAVGIKVFDLGPRQHGRESHSGVTRLDSLTQAQAFVRRLKPSRPVSRLVIKSPFGSGCAGENIANILGAIDPHDPKLIRKINAY